MDQNLKDNILDNLTKAENIVIVVAAASGFDGLAAGLALYLSLIKLDKNVSVVAKAPTVGDAQSLYGVDVIGRTGTAKIPVVVVDNAIETVDKVTYFLDKTKLKVVIHPLPGTQEITKDQISIEYASAPANLIFAVGIDSLPNLRSEFTHEQEISPDAWIINISNYESSQKFAQIDVVNTQAAGLSEVASKMLQDLALPVDEDIAYNLYFGIKAGTNDFSPNQVSPLSFEIASWLLKFGAGKASLARIQPIDESRRASLAKASLGQAAQPTSAQTTQYTQESKANFQPYPMPKPFLPDIEEMEEEPDFYEKVPSVEEVETEPAKETPKSEDWLKPPKMYKGSKSVGGENKG